MTAFTKGNFDMGHGSERWVMYHTGDKPSHAVRPVFIARFKYHKPAANANHFVKFLIKHFTVEEFFGMAETEMSRSKILETKGFVNYNVLQARKAA